MSIFFLIALLFFGFFWPYFLYNEGFSLWLFDIPYNSDVIYVVFSILFFFLIGRLIAKILSISISSILLPSIHKIESAIAIFSKHKIVLFLQIILIFALLIMVLYGADNYILNKKMKFDVYGEYSSFIHIFGLMTGLMSGVMYGSNKLFKYILFLSIVIFLISQSRSVVILTLLVTFNMFFNKKYILSIAWIAISIFSYYFVIDARGKTFDQYFLDAIPILEESSNKPILEESSNKPILEESSNKQTSLGLSLDEIFGKNSHWNLFYKLNVDLYSTLSIASKIKTNSNFSLDNLLEYMIFTSPLPSFIYMNDYQKYTSYSHAVGGIANVGINTDIISGPFYSGGYWLSNLFWLFVGFTFYFLDKIGSLAYRNNHYIVFLVSLSLELVFFAIGSVAPTRAATRPLSYLFILLCFIYIYKFLIKKIGR